MDLLRFITAGSVDDGKSTLIGRLLYDTDSIKVDQLATIQKQTKNRAEGEIDLALFTDGLRAEREQGITIDVAYKYFNTPKRKFIIADAPGHIQYTRNMVTGASNADLIIILIDARNGVSEQTRRHSIIASLLRIPHVVVAINKMDLMDHSEEVYNNIVIDYSKMAAQLGLKDVTFIPISAYNGDNIVKRSETMTWYTGETLLHHLENLDVAHDVNLEKGRFAVQYVIRPQTDDLHDYRGYAGRISSGVFKKGDKISILPEDYSATIKTIERDGLEVDEAQAGESVVFLLEEDIDISRGDVFVPAGQQPQVTQQVDATLCWMDNRKLTPGNKYLLQVQSKVVRCVVKEISHKIDVNTLEKHPANEAGLNDIVQVEIKTATPVVYDDYTDLRAGGGAILIDETSFNTVAGCLLQQAVA
ncbi:MAG: GTP-binding protein [Mucilaginibacter polytrichastri]|nr:GTP-binding protein [Mucilaginibacter polytrichastri]